MANSKKYCIGIFIPNYLIEATEDVLKEAIEDNDTGAIEDFTRQIEKMKEWQENDAYVSTLEEYFDLIKELEETTQEPVSICHGGKCLSVGD
jgi:hypothetical protein